MIFNVPSSIAAKLASEIMECSRTVVSPDMAVVIARMVVASILGDRPVIARGGGRRSPSAD